MGPRVGTMPLAAMMGRPFSTCKSTPYTQELKPPQAIRRGLCAAASMKFAEPKEYRVSLEATADSLESRFEVLEEIQRGRFGIVRRAQCRTTKQDYACKTLAKDEQNSQELENELDILKSINHPNAMPLTAIYEDLDQ